MEAGTGTDPPSSVEVSIEDREGNTVISHTSSRLQHTFVIPNARLWWPWTMQPDDFGYMYTLKVGSLPPFSFMYMLKVGSPPPFLFMSHSLLPYLLTLSPLDLCQGDLGDMEGHKLIMIIMYIYHVLISAMSIHIIHINLSGGSI